MSVAKDSLAREEPLEIRLANSAGPDSAVAVTMRTPGHDFELAAGFLFSEGILGSRKDVTEIRYCTGPDVQDYNIVTVELRDPGAVHLSDIQRNFYTTSSCGVCGKASIEQVEALVPKSGVKSDGRLAGALIRRLPTKLRESQALFEKTGGAHGAGVFGLDGAVRWVREDVGRHNAVDKVVGAAFLDGALPLSDHILVVSGRASFELVQKAGAAGVTALVAVGAPSSLAVELAERLGMVLVGFTREHGYNIYTGAERVEPDPEFATAP